MARTAALVAAAATAAVAAALGPARFAPAADAAAPYQLLTDWRLSPVVGLESRAPLLAWAAPTSQAALASSRVQLFAAYGGGAPLWDATLPGGALQAAYAGPALANATWYVWRVQTTALADDGVSDWSANATFLTGVWSAGSGWAAAQPVWSANTSSEFVLLRSQVALVRVPAWAAVFVTANPQPSANGEHENGKLLGAYRLYVGGRLVGMGPGRPGRCGPVCPTGSGTGVCACTPEHVYDAYDVTADVAAAGAGSRLVLAIQAFNPPPTARPPANVDSKVVALLVAGYADGSSEVLAGTRGGDGGGWRALQADAWMNASCCVAEQWYYAPRENWVAAREPRGWRLPGFDDSHWEAPAACAPFSAPLVARTTLPLAVATGVRPANVTVLGPGHVFIDMGREVQGGLSVAFSNASDGQLVYVRLGEELLPPGTPGAPPAVRYEMRTGNSYWAGWTLRNATSADPAVVEHHEYLEWRYAELVAASLPPQLQCVVSATGDYTTPVTLACADPAAIITSVTFASFGTPAGACAGGNAAPGTNTFAVNASCAAPDSAAAVAKLCVGKVGSCTLVPTVAAFGGEDPCHYVDKWLAAAVTCNNSQPLPPVPPAAEPGWQADVTAWVLTYPAAYVPGGQVDVAGASPELQAVWDLCLYTVVATALDVYTDSNTRQRSPICSEAVLINLLMQWATSAEWAQQDYTLRYIANQSPDGLGWAEWQALHIFAWWEVWRHTGDLSGFAERYAQLRNFTELQLLAPNTGLWTCPPAGNPFSCTKPEIDWPSNLRDGFVFKPANTVVNAYTALAMRRFAEMAAALGGHDADAALFNATGVALAAALHTAVFNATTGSYVDGVGTDHTAWHSSLFALAMNVPPPDAAPAVWAYVVGRSVGDPTLCSPSNVYPAQWALEAFYANTSDYGHAGLAYLTCAGNNSWLAMVAAGATTTFESWQLAEKWNPTLSHSWGAAPANAIPRLLFGVMPEEPGFASLLVRPQPGWLPSGAATVPTLRGPVRVAFNQTLAPGGTFPVAVQLVVGVPGATPARVCLPSFACDRGVVTVDGVVQPAEADGAHYVCLPALPSGDHVLMCAAADSAGR